MADENKDNKDNKDNKKPEIKDLSTLNQPLSATTNLGVGKYKVNSFDVGKANNGHGTGTRGDTV